MPASQHHRSAVSAETGMPASVSPTISVAFVSAVGEFGDVDDRGDGGDVDAVAGVTGGGGLREELVQGVVAALRGGALDLVAVGVGCGFLGAVELAGAAVDGVAEHLTDLGGEVGVGCATLPWNVGEMCRDRSACSACGARPASPSVSKKARHLASTNGT